MSETQQTMNLISGTGALGSYGFADTFCKPCTHYDMCFARGAVRETLFQHSGKIPLKQSSKEFNDITFEYQVRVTCKHRELREVENGGETETI